MRTFRNKPFSRFARQEGISDSDLCDAIARAERGLVDDNLGGNVIKQRIPRPNDGRSGGFRTIVLFRVEERAFFVHGYAKNQRDNISANELKAFRELALIYLNLTDEAIEEAIEAEKLTEVNCDEQDV